MSPEPRNGQLRPAMRRTFIAFVTTGSVLSALPSAQAEPPTVTTVKYYTVNATTAQSLDQQMIARGPVHGPGRAYANIVARPDYSGRLVQGQSCRLEDFTVRAEFTMTLPKLSAGVQLSPDLKARWESFQAFVRRHEEGHRDIWIDTMRTAERRISALRAPTCQQLQTMIDGVFQEEWRAGERRQDAYDRADQQKLVRHPLLVAASAARRKVGSALAPRSAAAQRPAPASQSRRLGGRAM
jgi:predicted secreted Zn-dependent protease